jgi:hypothetical protein
MEEVLRCCPGFRGYIYTPSPLSEVLPGSVIPSKQYRHTLNRKGIEEHQGEGEGGISPPQNGRNTATPPDRGVSDTDVVREAERIAAEYEAGHE